MSAEQIFGWAIFLVGLSLSAMIAEHVDNRLLTLGATVIGYIVGASYHLRWPA